MSRKENRDSSSSVEYPLSFKEGKGVTPAEVVYRTTYLPRREFLCNYSDVNPTFYLVTNIFLSTLIGGKSDKVSEGARNAPRRYPQLWLCK